MTLEEIAVKPNVSAVVCGRDRTVPGEAWYCSITLDNAVRHRGQGSTPHAAIKDAAIRAGFEPLTGLPGLPGFFTRAS